MDETLRELVSRYLDGDLDEAEAVRLEERARTDAELAAEIDSGRQLRAAVAGLADRMAVPATLDKVMEPLRRSEPAPVQRVRPAYRWLGAAAAIVLGVTVAMEVAQRNPEPSSSRPSAQRIRPMHEREEIFKLAPLPTANPDERRPIGATDRLLEEDLVQPAPPEPPPLEVIGPLPTGEPAVVSNEASSRPGGDSSTVDGEVEKTPTLERHPAQAKSRAAVRTDAPGTITSIERKRNGLPASDGDRGAGARTVGAGKSDPEVASAGRQDPPLSAVLRINGVEVWAGGTSSCSAGTRRVQIEVREGRVVSVRSSHETNGGGEIEFDDACVSKELLGSAVAGVLDGIHFAEIVVADSTP